MGDKLHTSFLICRSWISVREVLSCKMKNITILSSKEKQGRLCSQGKRMRKWNLNPADPEDKSTSCVLPPLACPIFEHLVTILINDKKCFGSCRYKRWGHESKEFALTSISYWSSCILFKAPFPPLLRIYSVFFNLPCSHDRFLSFHWYNFVPRVFSHKLSHRTQ